MLEIVQLSNGDIVLRDPDHGAEPLLRIQFSREVRTMLGADAMQVGEADDRSGGIADVGSVEANDVGRDA